MTFVNFERAQFGKIQFAQQPERVSEDQKHILIERRKSDDNAWTHTELTHYGRH